MCNLLRDRKQQVLPVATLFQAARLLKKGTLSLGKHIHLLVLNFQIKSKNVCGAGSSPPSW